MIPPQLLAASQLWRPVRFAVLVVVVTFFGGFGLALGGLAAIRLLGHLLVTWGCP